MNFALQVSFHNDKKQVLFSPAVSFIANMDDDVLVVIAETSGEVQISCD